MLLGFFFLCEGRPGYAAIRQICLQLLQYGLRSPHLVQRPELEPLEALQSRELQQAACSDVTVPRQVELLQPILLKHHHIAVQDTCYQLQAKIVFL